RGLGGAFGTLFTAAFTGAGPDEDDTTGAVLAAGCAISIEAYECIGALLASTTADNGPRTTGGRVTGCGGLTAWCKGASRSSLGSGGIGKRGSRSHGQLGF